MHLHALAQFGDQALRGFREQLRRKDKAIFLNQGCGQNQQHQPVQEMKRVPFGMTPSNKNLVEYGSTRLATRLITISRKPRLSRARRGRVSSQTIGNTARKRCALAGFADALSGETAGGVNL